MITYEQYVEQFAKENGFDTEVLFQFGISGCTLEEFTKGYAKFVAEAQIKECRDYLQNVYYDIENTPLIELK